MSRHVTIVSHLAVIIILDSPYHPSFIALPPHPPPSLSLSSLLPSSSAMSQQWGAGQPGYQYPMQTGFPGAPGQFQQQGFNAPQPTGFPGQQRPGFQQAQPTGFAGQNITGFQPQQTGFQPGMTGLQVQIPPVPPVPPLPSSITASGFRPAPQPPMQGGPPPIPQRSYLPTSPAPSGFGSGGIVPQVTGFPGAGPLVPQVTGYMDPRLQMMSTTFMPANPAMPYAGGVPQFNTQALQNQGGLVQSIQQYNQDRGNPAQRMSWALTKAEKKNYDQIFRAWDVQNTGFISGQMALEVFGQSGLEKNDLARIWYGFSAPLLV